MATIRLQMAPDPLARPVTVADCRQTVRPCPRVWCRHNLLVDVLDDGNMVLNYPSRRLTGAERTIPDKHDSERQWFVEVRVTRYGHDQIFALGPCGSVTRAEEVAAEWARVNADESADASRMARAVAKAAEIDRAARVSYAKVMAGARTRGEASIATATKSAHEITASAKLAGDELIEHAKTKGRAARARKRNARNTSYADRLLTAAKEQAIALMSKARPRAQLMVESSNVKAKEILLKVKPRADEILAQGRAKAKAVIREAKPKPFAVIYRTIPDDMQLVGDRREGTVDEKFGEEIEDAVDYWFDEPSDTLRSCVLDEVDRDVPADVDDGYLLEQIAKFFHVTRERIRQVELIAMQKFLEGCIAAGITKDQLYDSGWRL